MAATVVTRFAPSPTGRLHLGHAHSALLGWQAAREAGGRFLLRIEDIDPVRCRPEYTEGILEDLRWLGLDWDGEPRIQSRHLPDYRAVLDRLEGMGLLYPCFCTRADIAREVAAIGHAPHGPDGLLYPGTCRRLSQRERAARIAAGQPYALRLDMAAALARLDGPLFFEEAGRGRLRCDPARFGDVVLARKDIPASYHLCVTHDDALQGVTLVTRAEDLLPATDLHRLLQALLDWPAPRYRHHPLLLGPDGKRLSKRDNAPTLAALREVGQSPEAVRAMALGAATSPAGSPASPGRSPS
ncbi:tRNA glutamyl-Q(34) synthetase GluQRS [Pseudoroseomonas ludipueritiae]|uniref:tRNA glutamyl-Q(34) synthetase GluQRS n=1 Tax=Pseudoroseomonas ludipueritiae TaxID=198093 RepID=A0ABR7R8J9_9PROT|nr:tRNA glutamyl-Q(34) synthetase GluQRS [Pseudoroseomonas ludipueritiae]MBC9178073.1 tRNA glutamyl-Q(34) synthetase GluQRS [Pseudoroseomonas ludipueritiae]